MLPSNGVFSLSQQMYKSLRCCVFRDDTGQIYTLFDTRKLVTALGKRKVELGDVVRVRKVSERAEGYDTKIFEICKFPEIIILECDEDLYPIPPSVELPYLGQPFVLAYFDQDELKFELGEVTSVKCDEKHYVGSIKSQRDIPNGGGLFGDRSYVRTTMS